MSSEDQRDLYKGLDDGWARAIELVVTPGVAAGIGYLIDRWLGTFPAFTIVFLVLAVVATFIKLWYAYDAKMRAIDAASPWGRKAEPAASKPESS
jgi:F0F1-type ATP synthase assembly protein I